MKFLKKKLHHPGFRMRELRFFLEKFTQPGKKLGIDSPEEYHAEQALIFV